MGLTLAHSKLQNTPVTHFIFLPYFFLNLSDLGADVELLWPFRISICYCVFSTAFDGGRLICSTTVMSGQVDFASFFPLKGSTVLIKIMK